MNWPRVELGSVAPAKASKHALAPDDEVWMLNLDQIEADTGVLLNKVIESVASAGSSTHGFDERHVLYSKLRPYLNKVVLPDDRGLATTELVPMLPDPLRLDRKYLAYYLRSKSFVDWVSTQVAGAKMPRVSMQLFWKHEIPLPPLPEQKRIAAILDKADAIRRKRQQAIQLADDFLRAVFLDMFGDPVTNPKGWDIVELSTLVDPNDRLNYGVVQPGENEENGVPLVRSGDLADFTPDVNQLRRVSTSIDTKHRSSRLKGNEILIACVGSIGRVGWVSDEMIGWNIARAVTRIPIREGINREYVYRYLQNPVVQGYFERETRAVAQPTLNVGLIAKTPVAVPPLELQTEFLRRYQTVQSYKNRLMSILEVQDVLVGALSQKAFRGEL